MCRSATPVVRNSLTLVASHQGRSKRRCRRKGNRNPLLTQFHRKKKKQIRENGFWNVTHQLVRAMYRMVRLADRSVHRSVLLRGLVRIVTGSRSSVVARKRVLGRASARKRNPFRSPGSKERHSFPHFFPFFSK